MARAAARLTRHLLAALSLLASAAAAQGPAWVVDGNCRDGQPHGLYELRDAQGVLRVAGAFNHGKRTSSFIFWSARGGRIAHIPYDDDRRNGTLATWYDDGRTGTEPTRQFESAWRNGEREGLTRSWNPDGRRRSETDYANGVLIASSGWSDAGTRVADAQARDLADGDARKADAQFDALEQQVREHLPRCD